ncbi:MAG: hypothetical protein A2284_10830 [Deltaproteobacteria bacterium RIFOXYA12_FULL_61_11]|nr:MAG: hypothetical protein A2284_10830 [Deltaproteobacteria bacterium RIFOXYA12_FULL_61_11]
MSVEVLAYVVLAAYTIACGTNLAHFFRLERGWERASTLAIALTFALHSWYLVLFALEEQILPFFSIRDFLVIIGWFLLLFLFYLEAATHDRSFRLFLLLISSILHLSTQFIPYYHHVGSLQVGPLLGVHILMVMISYACFIVSFSAALMYVFLYSEIKRRRPGFFFERFTSLERLERLDLVAQRGGLLFLTLGILAGYAWAYQDPVIGVMGLRTVFTVLIWLFYCAGAAYRHRIGLTGLRQARFTLFGFGLLLCNVALGIFGLGSHAF